MSWRPIETAPEKADALLICARNGAVVISPWPFADESDIDPEDLAKLAEMGVFPDDGWKPAYWMPVPAPPADLKTAEPAWARGKPTAPQ